MNCNKVGQLLSAYMDGELLGHEHRLIHHHLRLCTNCQAEYEELLQMKRLLAAMRLREPGKRLAATILERAAAAPAESPALTIGEWRIPLPTLRSRPAIYPPIIGFGVGLTVVGLMLWSSPPYHAAADGRVGGVAWEAANTTRDTPAPDISTLTNGLTRESSPPVTLDSDYPMDLPDFPITRRSAERPRTSFERAALIR